jgi:hypothetical protein
MFKLYPLILHPPYERGCIIASDTDLYDTVRKLLDSIFNMLLCIHAPGEKFRRV